MHWIEISNGGNAERLLHRLQVLALHGAHGRVNDEGERREARGPAHHRLGAPALTRELCAHAAGALSSRRATTRGQLSRVLASSTEVCWRDGSRCRRPLCRCRRRPLPPRLLPRAPIGRRALRRCSARRPPRGTRRSVSGCARRQSTRWSSSRWSKRTANGAPGEAAGARSAAPRSAFRYSARPRSSRRRARSRRRHRSATRGEVALIGRSNVGKSTLLNSLTNSASLARVSDKPGRTQQLTFFECGAGATASNSSTCRATALRSRTRRRRRRAVRSARTTCSAAGR